MPDVLDLLPRRLSPARDVDKCCRDVEIQVKPGHPIFQRLGLISGAEHIRRQVLAENSSVFRYIYDRLVIFVAYYSPRVEGPAVTPIRPPYYLDIRSPQAVTAQHRQEAFHHRTICFKSFFETCLLAADLTACGL